MTRHLRACSRPAGRNAGVFAFTKAVNAQPAASGLRGVFASPAYRRLWAARTVSQWGDVFATVTLALLVLHLTGSALGVTGVVLAEIVPVLLLAPLAGTLVDPLPRVRVMVGADLFRAALAAVLPLLDGHVSAVYAVAFGLATGNVLFSPAAGSALPTLVDDAQLVPANSGIWTAAVLSQIALAPWPGSLSSRSAPASPSGSAPPPGLRPLPAARRRRPDPGYLRGPAPRVDGPRRLRAGHQHRGRHVQQPAPSPCPSPEPWAGPGQFRPALAAGAPQLPARWRRRRRRARRRGREPALLAAAAGKGNLP